MTRDTFDLFQFTSTYIVYINEPYTDNASYPGDYFGKPTLDSTFPPAIWYHS